MAKPFIPAGQCGGDSISEGLIHRVRSNMPSEAALYNLAELYKMFGDSTRIRILWALDEAEMCVCDIACLLNMSQSAISHQLRALKQFNLVRFRRSGKKVYYSLDDDHVRLIFEQGLAHIREDRRRIRPEEA